MVEGIVAGYGIAIPVGAIAVLIIDTALRGGFQQGFMAGAGAATADFTYATMAALVGVLVKELVKPYIGPLTGLSGAALIALGGWGLARLRAARQQPAAYQRAEMVRPLSTYLKFVSLTLINPQTVIYFIALIIGGSARTLATLDGKILFVIGAGLSSLSWQSLLAAIGALAHRHLPPQFQVVTSVVGNLVVIGLGVRIVALLLMGST